MRAKLLKKEINLSDVSVNVGRFQPLPWLPFHLLQVAKKLTTLLDFTATHLIKINLQCIFLYCFLRFFLKCVLVCDTVFSITVAWTVAIPSWTKGRPTNVKSVPPINITCRNTSTIRHTDKVATYSLYLD